MEIENRIVQVAACLAHPLNYNRHPPEQMRLLRASLRKFGQVRSIVVQDDGAGGYVVVAGHGVWEAATFEGLEVLRADVIPVDWPEVKVLAYLAADNETARGGDPDEAQLAAIVASVGEEDDVLAELAAGGEAQMQKLLSSLGEQAPPPPAPQVDRAEELRRALGVEPGQLWEIPSVKTPGLVHRLLCGDALSVEDVARLLQGEGVRLAVTDPPYGVEVDHSWRDTTQGRTSPRGGGIMNDDRADWGEVYPLFGVEVVYVFHASNFAGEVEAGLEREGYRVRQQIIWVKKSLTLSRAAYQWRHEPLFYAVREEAPRGRPVAWRMRRRGYEQAHGAVWYAVRKGSPAGWRGGRAQTTVWEFESPIHATAHNEGATLHPTEKPVECYEIPIRNHTLRGEAVTDPFGGSGTMIFAAERTGRRALVMEIDPRWVAVAIDRAQRQGLDPRLVERGDG